MKHDEAFTFIQQISADLAKGVIAFPTSFDTTLRLRELLQSETSSVADLTRIVQMDPLLAARIVQAANSVALNPTGARVADLRNAVTRLGLLNVRMLALSLAMQQFIASKPMAGFAHITGPLISFSRDLGGCALVIAREHTRIPPELALFAGLIHDLGAFYLLYRLASRGGTLPDAATVTQLLEDWRVDVGRGVLAALDVPQAIQEAIALHRWPRHVESIRGLDELLYVCRLLLRWLAGEPDATDPDTVATVAGFEQYLATLDACRDEVAAASSLF